ncbi:Pimeloyl-ACP methyl ester carboxylesterase [Desulfocicer vacuolatum DSM 3385]|uniref:Pimeloyl-ACP methyl ester carboxylesterase n=1 Tax=Desulfocicer vacuolatum DSM 3385 TaxID=1121400 RepID=A0A1W2DGY8_9BACT|nr:alpha/beta hydrolase [Desulfocicer vacuolatum]SMC96780.1 Pimeloyl-ACP methyl ester carboxylesterase [Desulfocicer vacuolatum DSM 3385]
MKKTVVYMFYIVWILLFAGCASQNHVSIKQLETIPVLKAKVNGVELGYRIVGKGSPILMIIGYACTMDAWDSQMISELSKKHRVIMFDNRGAGYSTINKSKLTISQMMLDAVQLLDVLTIEKTDVMGWSMGSIIAQEMLLAYPDRVGKAILYSTSVDVEPVKKALDSMAALGKEEFRSRLFPNEWKTLNPEIYSRLPGNANVSAEVVRRQYKAIVNWKSTRTKLKDIDNSVLILSGEDDRVTPLDQSLAASSLIPGAWLVRFKAADHWMMYQAPTEIAKTVDFFLSTEQDLLLVK